MVKWLQGKKTYAVAITGGIVTALVMLGYEVPAWVGPELATLGLGFLKAGLERRSEREP